MYHSTRSRTHVLSTRVGFWLLRKAVNKPMRVLQMHTLSRLPFDPSTGVPPFLSTKAVNVIYNQHQVQILGDLNLYLSKVPTAKGRSLHDVITVMNNKPEMGHVFNTASQIWNNDFFLQHLCQTAEEVPMNPLFKKSIEREWDTLENFKDDFKYHAQGIFGCGWTWLVRDSYDNLRLLNTFNAGSPHIPQFKPGFDNTRRKVGSSGLIPRSLEYNRYSPVLCLNVWELAYVPDYGVNGREQYIDNFWKVVDWDKVAKNLSVNVTDSMRAISQ